jgi:hypothetical protein
LPNADERRAAERDVRLHRDPDARVGATDFLDGEAVGDEVAARAAVLGGQVEAHQPESGHLLDDVIGELLGAVERGGARADSPLGEVAGEVAPAGLFGGEVEVHRVVLRDGDGWAEVFGGYRTISELVTASAPRLASPGRAFSWRYLATTGYPSRGT